MSGRSSFDWSDPFFIEHQLTDVERMMRDAASAFAADQLATSIERDYLTEQSDPGIFRAMGEAGLLGVTVPDAFGGSGAGYVLYGLVAREIERIDSGCRSMMSVQSSLVIYPIMAFGSEAQKARYLPRLTSGELIGCFGLTEPDAGSDPGSMRTKAIKTANGYRIKGSKIWISNAPIADIFVVWAKSDAHDGKITGFVLERSITGLSAPKIEGKLSLRASITGEIVMDDVEVGEDAILPGVEGLRGPFECLDRARYGIAWGVMGAAEDLLAPRVGRLMGEDAFAPEMISLIKRNNCGKALDIARTARDMHGGTGIQIEYGVMRHAQNLETVSTYEGTHDVHALILGRAQTGLQAFF